MAMCNKDADVIWIRIFEKLVWGKAERLAFVY